MRDFWGLNTACRAVQHASPALMFLSLCPPFTVILDIQVTSRLTCESQLVQLFSVGCWAIRNAIHQWAKNWSAASFVDPEDVRPWRCGFWRVICVGFSESFGWTWCGGRHQALKLWLVCTNPSLTATASHGTWS